MGLPESVTNTQPVSRINTGVLIVDDDDLSNQVVSRRLTQEGYVVTAAQNGNEALQRLDLQAFGLILLDLDMPEPDGLETLKRIRQHPRAGNTPVIMLSAKSDSDSIEKCLAAGATDYIVKPLVIPLVRARIEHCLHPGSIRRDTAAQTSSHSPAPATRVLIVDDEDLNCRLLIHQLKAPGIQAIGATSARQALEIVAQQPVDVVLLDVRMPDISGIELLRSLRENKATRSLPVIMVSGASDVSTMLQCIDHGADGYITKPVDVGYLRSCIASAVEARRLGLNTAFASGS